MANLIRLCKIHHVQYDGGSWRLHLRRDGVIVMIDRRGVTVGELLSASGTAAAERPPP